MPDLQKRLVSQLNVKAVKSPDVTIQVEEYRPFFILGEVKNPGSYPYVPEMTVLTAVAIAGGFTFRAVAERGLGDTQAQRRADRGARRARCPRAAGRRRLRLREALLNARALASRRRRRTRAGAAARLRRRSRSHRARCSSMTAARSCSTPMAPKAAFAPALFDVRAAAGLSFGMDSNVYAQPGDADDRQRGHRRGAGARDERVRHARHPRPRVRARAPIRGCARPGRHRIRRARALRRVARPAEPPHRRLQRRTQHRIAQRHRDADHDFLEPVRRRARRHHAHAPVQPLLDRHAPRREAACNTTPRARNSATARSIAASCAAPISCARTCRGWSPAISIATNSTILRRLSLSADTVGGLAGIALRGQRAARVRAGRGLFRTQLRQLRRAARRRVAARLAAVASHAPDHAARAGAAHRCAHRHRRRVRQGPQHACCSRRRTNTAATSCCKAACDSSADDFETIDRVDTSWVAEIGATWAFGRHSVLRFTYGFGTRDHETPERSFERHVASLAYIARL